VKRFRRGSASEVKEPGPSAPAEDSAGTPTEGSRSQPVEVPEAAEAAAAPEGATAGGAGGAGGAAGAAVGVISQPEVPVESGSDEGAGAPEGGGPPEGAEPDEEAEPATETVVTAEPEPVPEPVAAEPEPVPEPEPAAEPGTGGDLETATAGAVAEELEATAAAAVQAAAESAQAAREAQAARATAQPHVEESLPTVRTPVPAAATGSSAATLSEAADESAPAPVAPSSVRLVHNLPPRPASTAPADAGGRGRWVASDGAWETTLRGRLLMNDPRLFRGVAFTEDERRALGLVGLLPPQVIPLHEQLTRALGQYHAQPTDLAKYVYLELLRDRNEVLFFRLLSEHLAEMLPVVYTPTVGEAIQHYSQEYRRPRGVFLSVDHPDDIELSLTATGLGPDDVDLIVATDGEAILGIGDWGVGGIAISLGKLALYTAAGGIDPGRTIALVLDVGTNREALLADPLYLGNRHPRVDEATYDGFIDGFVEIATRLFPNALLHWEDLAARNARRILQRWRGSVFTFNDDIQGTGAVALAAVLSGLKRSRGRLADQRVVIFGAGTAGVGIAEQLRDAMVADGLDTEEARRRFWLVGRHGLLLESLDSLGIVMHDYQRPWARRDEDVAGWTLDEDGKIGLSEVIRNVAATVLIGTSGQPGAFTENIIRNMALSCQHPIILPLSNPTELVEAEPWDILQWTGGRALVATGSAFDPVTYAWSTHYIGQANNAFVFPGLGLGAILVGATQVTDHMLSAAAAAISAQVDMSREGAPLLPEIETLHSTSAAVALAVIRAAIEDGVARWAPPDPPEEGIEAAMWKPEYRPIRAV